MAVIPPSGPIGLFDSGLGGLTVLRELQRAVPTQQYIYLGDNARFPYGTKSNETIQRYARECAGFLLDQGVELVIVACNTASAAALECLERELPVPVIGTIGPAVRTALATTKNRVVGVLGTNATVSSGAYENALSAQAPDISVVSRACPLFVPLVETGMLSGEIVEKVVELYLEPIASSKCDTVILGCTHYPLLVEAIRAYLGSDVQIVECSKAIAQEVSERRRGATAKAPVDTRYFVTDEVGRFNYLATAYLGGAKVDAARVESLEDFRKRGKTSFESEKHRAFSQFRP